MSFAPLAAAQAATGYTDAVGTPLDGVEESLEFVDAAIGRMVQALKARKLHNSTWITVTSPYGQSPMDQRRRRLIPLDLVRAAVEAVQPGLAAHLTGGDTVMIWLSDPAETAVIVKAFSDRTAALRIEEIYYGARLSLTLNSPEKDSRMRDIILQPELGVLWR